MIAAILNSAILDSAILHKTLTQTSSIWLKLILPDLPWWWQPSWILQCWIQPFCTKLWLKLVQSDSTHSLSLNSMMAAILNSAILHSAILHKTLTQTSSIWLKLIHSDTTWWCQTSWILLSWIQTLPSWIQTPCYLLSDSLKNTLPPLWLFLKLITSD